MPRTLAALLLAALPAAALADAPAGKVVAEEYETAYLGGGKAGFTRYTVRETDRDGQKVLRASRDLQLTVRRFNGAVSLQVETGTEETPDGKVVGVFMTQKLGTNVNLVMNGTVADGVLDIRFVGGQGKNTSMKWDPRAVGMIAEQNWLRDHKAKPGDPIEYRTFEPTVTTFVTVKGKVVGVEEVTVEGVGPRKLLRAEVQPEPIAGVQLPGSVGWYDPETLDVVRTESEVPGLGKLVLVRSAKAAATAKVTPPKVDVGIDNSIRLPGRVADIHRLNSLTYRIEFTAANSKLTPDAAFAVDGRRQYVTWKSDDGRMVDLKVWPVRAPRKVKGPVEQPGDEYRRSNFFITSDDDEVKKHAAEAVGDLTDPWDKAQAIEKWVRANMKSLNFQQSMAPASEVARQLSGDCSEFSMLTAAMCRAAGIPSRTAIGLVYVELPRPTGPALAYHMWTEVWVKDQWLAIDATLGLGSVGAGHLKIADHHWDGVQDLKPTLPVLNVMMGKPRVTPQ